MKRINSLAFFLLLAVAVNGQKYMTKTGFISFFSTTPMEDIKAENNQVAGAFDSGTGDLVFQVLITAFRFEKSLMQEHFNENYMDSEKFPKAVFKGKIMNLASVDFRKAGKYEVKVEGDLTIRDVTKKVSSSGTLEVHQGGVNADSKFSIIPEDYGVKIPSVVRDKIAKSMDVTVSMKYTPVAAN